MTVWPALVQRGQERRHRGRAVARPRAQLTTVERELADARHALERPPHVAVGRLAAQLDLQRVAVERALELVRRAGRDDLPAVDDRELRGQLVGLLEVVRREQDRHLLLLRQPADLAPHLGARLGIEARRRLVEEQHGGLVQQPERDVELARHAARVGLGRPVGGRGQAEVLEQLVHAPLEALARDVVDLALQDEVLASRGGGVEAGLLPDDADRAPHARGVGQHVDARHARLAGVGPAERREDLDRRRLAGAVRAEQREDRARRGAEREPVERPHALAVGLRELGRFDCAVQGQLPASSPAASCLAPGR